MFGDLKGMMSKLKDAQENIAAAKLKMNTVLIDEQSNDGLLKVTITANRELKKIEIEDSLLVDKEQLEDYLLLTLNKAIQKATDINDAEVAAAASEGMPNPNNYRDLEMDMFGSFIYNASGFLKIYHATLVYNPNGLPGVAFLVP